MFEIICKITYCMLTTIDKNLEKQSDYLFSITNLNKYENHDNNIFYDIKTLYTIINNETEIGDINNEFIINDFHLITKFILNIEIIKPFWKKIPKQIQLYIHDWNQRKEITLQNEPYWIKEYVKKLFESKESEKSKELYD